MAYSYLSIHLKQCGGGGGGGGGGDAVYGKPNGQK